jgi:hypothetical protein
MNAPSPLLRPLQGLAVVETLAIAVLFVLWWRMEPELPLAGDVPPRTEPAVVAPVADRATVDAAANSAPPPLAAPATEAPPANDADRLAVLYGTVRGADGTPMPRGVFWLYLGGKHVATASAELGAFVFPGLRPGTYQLRSRIDDQIPIDRRVDVVAPTTRLDLELPARWLLTVKAVTPDGLPWREVAGKQAPMALHRGLSALAFDAPLPGDLPLSNLSEVEGGLGRFRTGNDPLTRGAAMPKDVLGVLTLPPDQPVHVALILRQTVLAQQPVAASQPEVTFTLPADALLAKLARVRLRVVDANGAPVAKAHVACNDAQTGGGGKPSGDDGRVELEHLVPGRLDLEIWAKDLSAPPVEIDVLPGADLDLGDVVLVPPVNVELQFDNLGGKGSVRCTMLDSIRPGWRANELYFSVENGGSRTHPFYPARYGLVATGPSGVALQVLDLRIPPPGPVRFDMRRGAELTIEYAFGVSTSIVEVTSAEGLRVRRREVGAAGSETVELPPGSYSVRVTDPSGASTRRDFVLPTAGLVVKLP